jgi:hypothetical protein
MPGSPRKDYLEQQIEGVARLLARLLGLRDAGRVEEARAELDKGARTLLGVGMMPLGRVDVATAVGLLRSQAGAESYARLLEAEAELDPDKADALRERARAVREAAS